MCYVMLDVILCMLYIADPFSMSTQKGALLLRPGASQEGYQQTDDGTVVTSSGQALSPGVYVVHYVILVY